MLKLHLRSLLFRHRNPSVSLPIDIYILPIPECTRAPIHRKTLRGSMDLRMDRMG